MKKIYILFIIGLFGLQIKAQVLNAGLESWTTKTNQIHIQGQANIGGFPVTYEIDDPPFTYNDLVDWSSLNQLTKTESIVYPSNNDPNVELVTQSTDAVEGTYSTKLESKIIKIKVTASAFGVTFDTSVTNVAPGMMVSGVFDLDENAFADQLVNSSNLSSLDPFSYNGTGQAINYRPGTLYGMYKYTGINGDSALVVTGVVKNRQVIAYAIKRLPPTITWIPFSVDYEYLNCDMPDTIVTLFCSSNLDASFTGGNFTVNSSYTGENGSFLYVDDLSLDTLDASVFPPEAMNDNSTISNVETAVLDVTLNDINCDPSGNAPVIINAGTNGTATNGTGDELEYTPNAGYSGTDAVTYYICNAGGACDTATWTITVTSVPPCVANDDFRSVTSGGSSVFDPRTNDDDCGGMPQIITNPYNGTAAVEQNGFISYSPLSGYSGADSLTYVICSPLNTSQCDTAVIYYDVISSVIDLSKQGVTISPNPTKDIVNIKVDLNNAGTTTATVYNLLGKEVYKTSFINYTQINLKDFPSGVYLLNFENKLGKGTQKLVLTK